MTLQNFKTSLTAAILISMILTSIGLGRNATSRKALAPDRVGAAANSAGVDLLIDLTQRAKDGAVLPVNGIESELARLFRVLGSAKKKNAVLAGDFADGRSLIIDNLALAIAENSAPAGISAEKMFELDLNAVISRAKDQADAERIFDEVLSDIESAERKVILVIAGAEGFSGTNPVMGKAAANHLQKMIIGEKVQVVVSGTAADYNKNIATDAKLRNYFQLVNVQASESELADPFVGDKISPDLRELAAGLSPAELVKVVLQAGDIASPELRRLLAADDVAVISEARGLNMLILEMPLGSAERLVAAAGSKHLSLVRNMNQLGHLEAATGVNDMRAVPGNENLNGRGIGIAILDSAMYKDHHVFLDASGRSRVVKNKEFADGGNEDKFGHGTHVAAIATGRGGKPGDAESTNQLSNFRGIAPEASIIPLRVLDNDGRGSTIELIEALNWVLENRLEYNIRVVNLSLGTAAVETWRNDPLCRAVRRLTSAGIVVVAAAGNDGKNAEGTKIYGRIHSPGNDPTVITVGASNSFNTDGRYDDGIATYSSRGPTRSFFTDNRGQRHYDHLIKPEIAAPGNKIIAAASKRNKLLGMDTSLLAFDWGNEKTRLMSMSGTSMAAPVVSGTVALMLQANPNLTPNLVKTVLMYTAQPLSGFNNLEQGAGEINAEGAVRLAKSIRTDLNNSTPLGAPMLVPTLISNEPFGESVIAGQPVKWSQGAIIDTAIAQGSELITNYQRVYGTGILLGDGLLLSDGTFTGDGILLGDGLLLSDGILRSDGRTISDGTTILDWSDTFGSGLLLSDGFLLSDGLLMSDGLLPSDGTVGSNTFILRGD